MNDRTRAILVIAVFAAVLIAGYEFFLKPYFAQERKVDTVLHAYSAWNVTMQAYLINGPISAETYRVSNDDGKVKMFYSATSRSGLVTKQFDVQLVGPTATFLFEELRAEGVWELEDKAVRPHPLDEYIISVYQRLGDQGGSRAFGFSDPVYWANTTAREFMLHSLPTASATGGSNAETTTAVSGRSLRDERYLKIVRSFKNFGPESVQQAEAKIRADLIEADANLRPVRAAK
jgi:hypothetical protein